MKLNKKIVERPQHMWLRVAIEIHRDDIESVKETYNLMSEKYFTHATPTLFNAGTPRPQLSSCYLIAMESDSIDGIFDTLRNVLIYPNGLVELDYIFITFVQRVLIFVEQMEHQMALSL